MQYLSKVFVIVYENLVCNFHSVINCSIRLKIMIILRPSKAISTEDSLRSPKEVNSKKYLDSVKTSYSWITSVRQKKKVRLFILRIWKRNSAEEQCSRFIIWADLSF